MDEVSPCASAGQPGHEPFCVCCDYNLIGSLGSQRCPECGWPIDWNAASVRRYRVSLVERVFLTALLAFGIAVLHFGVFFVTGLMVFVDGLDGLATMEGRYPPGRERWKPYEDAFISSLEVVGRVLSLPMTGIVAGCQNLTLVHAAANSAFWGISHTACVAGIRTLRKRRQVRGRAP